jgi:quinol monooxygenase YgiN
MPRPKRRPPRKKSRAGRGSTLARSVVTLTVTLHAREGQEALLEAELHALVAPTRREEGCIAYDLYRAAEIAGAFFLHEVWASREHHTRHTKTPHFLRWKARQDALLASREAIFWIRVA